MSDPVRPKRRADTGEVREAIIQVAAELIGNVGYQNTSISRIADRAGIAQGSFYSHFSSRQQLFDELLPLFHERMLKHVRNKTKSARDIFDLERRGLVALISYVEANPFFARLLSEAEYYAPTAYAAHHEDLLERSAQTLKRASANGQIRRLAADETLTVAKMLLASRTYLVLDYFARGANQADLASIVAVYLDFVGCGLRPLSTESVMPAKATNAENVCARG